MKVVHVTTVDAGGAANAAYRLHEELSKSGIDSKFLVLYDTNTLKGAVAFKTPFSNFFYFFVRKMRNRVLRHQTKRILAKLNTQVEIFSSPVTIYDITAHPLIKNADLIHFHWVANFVDYKSFFRRNRKPLVWTLHDENPIYGGVHYKGDILKLSSALLKLEKSYQEIKKKALVRAQKIWLICPSPWLMNEVLLSDFRGTFKQVTCIYYGIDTEKFKLLDKQKSREQLGFPMQKKLILLICSNLNIHRKGFDLFCEVTKKVKDDYNVEFIIAGDISSLPPLKFSRYIGAIKDPKKLVQLYNAVDATLIPSREDNLPNVMIESLACGTPILGFKIGGIQNIVEENVDGLLAENVNADALYDLAIKFLSIHEFDRQLIRNRAIEKFSNNTQVSKVTKLYQECIQYNA